MEKLEQNLSYDMKKLILGSLIIGLVFSGCFEEEKKVIKKKDKAAKIVQKIIKQADSNKSLSDIIEDDGIIVDGARDESLLDAFGLAVSQVMMEEGVSVPDCVAVAKTEYLTEEECREITEKYSGFYDITQSGDSAKIDNVFSDGIKGKSVEFFDSSGNPLLENDIEFNEVVANSNDIGMLKKLKAKIPIKKVDMLENINNKIDFLDDVQQVQESREIENVVEQIIINGSQDKSNNYNQNNSGYNNNDDQNNKSDYYKKDSQLKALILKHMKTKSLLSQYPNDGQLIDRYNQEEMDISILEQEVMALQSDGN